MSFTYIKNIGKYICRKLLKNKPNEAPTLSSIEKSTIEEVENARSNFKDADEDTIDLAIYELMAAEERLNLLIRDKKRSKR